MSYYTGTPQNSKAKLVRLGHELQHRLTRPWEHPQFGGVDEDAHIRGSKHLYGRAIDLNRLHGQHDENDTFDRFAIELMGRGWGVIWNRGNYHGDHLYHLHVETITSTAENYAGRVDLKGARWRPETLAVDGVGGPLTVSALQASMGTWVDGEMSWGGQVAKALQAFLNTELDDGLAIDGKAGRNTSAALSRFLGFSPTDHDYITAGHWRELQRRLNKHGHIARNA